MRFLLPVALLPVLFAACELPSGHRPLEEEMYTSRGFDALGSELLWEVLEIEVAKRGYELDATLTDRMKGDFETRWLEHLMPFRFEGKRKKMVGKVVEIPGREGWFQVKALIWVQRNADLEDPLDPRKAIWQDEAPDTAATEVFLLAVERHFPAEPTAPAPAAPGKPQPGIYDR